MKGFPLSEACGLCVLGLLLLLGGCTEEQKAAHRVRAAEAQARQDYSDGLLRSLRIVRVCAGTDYSSYIFRSHDGRLWLSSFQDVEEWGWRYIHPLAADIELKDVC